MKKTTTLLVALLCAVAATFAQTTFTESGIKYEIITGTNTVRVIKDSTIPANGIVDIPATVTNGSTTYLVTAIADWAFNNTSLVTLTLGDKVETIGNGAFQECSALTTLTLGSGVKTIGEQAFNKCTALTAVTIPDKVEMIGKFAFQGCSALTTLTLGSGVKAIGDYAFYYCSKLTSVTSLNPTPPAWGDYVFSKTATLNVPEGSKSAYEAIALWKAFKTIAAITTSVATASTSAAKVYALAGTLYVEGATQPYTIYSLTGAQVYVGSATSLTLPSGVYVVAIGKERRKVVVP